MERDQTALLEIARAELRAIGSELTDLRPFATGLEFGVFAASCEGRPVVVKVPWSRRVANANDTDQDARALIRQEAKLLTFARSLGVPAPEVLLVHLVGDTDLLVTTLTPNDGSQPNGEQLASLLARIHAAPAPALTLVGQPGTFEATIAERLARRAAVAETISGIRLDLPSEDELEAILSTREQRRSLLHLDVRAANVLTSRGRITGLIDWTNALVGDPALELARIAEYQSEPPDFRESYARHATISTTRARELVYRLDATVMLTVVFLSEAPDPAQAEPRLARALELARELRAELSR